RKDSHGEKGSFEVKKLGKRREMSNDKLQMSNQIQILNAKILLIWSDAAKYNRSDTTCGVNDQKLGRWEKGREISNDK
ncbi:hypothetical protein KAX97_06640, partial [candidate division WOR-3 bacterium]|nr:hypothetical protein [candidate division WOR-3 bacterium]